MKSYFDAEFFRANRQRLRQLFKGTAPIVLTGNALLQRNSDIAQPFRQDSSFWYLTGINEPEIVLVMDKDKEYLIVPERTDVRNIFDGQLDSSLIAKSSGVNEILPAKAGWKRLGARLKRAKTVATLGALPPYIETYEFYTNPARSSLINKLKSYSSDIELLDLKEHMLKMRVKKQPQELKALVDSINLTVDTFKKLNSNLSKFTSEHEVEGFLYQNIRNSGAHFGYLPMVASGKNAVVLHYDSNQSKLGDNELLLVDCGAEIEFYSADITRVFSKSAMTRRQREVYEAVAAVHGFALSNLKPGISIKQNEKQVEHYMGEKLRELGLIKTITKGTVRKYFPHATSHFLGLDLHDIGNYENRLESGMVLTIEPGIYIPEESIGIRLEDDILITDSGYENLSANLPISLS